MHIRRFDRTSFAGPSESADLKAGMARHLREIVINGRFLTQAIKGVQRYAFEVVRAMDDMLTEGELERPDARLEILIVS